VRVLVTGASGFIGAHCVRELLDRGHQVAILTRSADPPSRLKEVAGRIERIEGALGNLPRAALQTWKPEGCLHLAWYAEPGKYLEADENVDCLIGSLALLRTLISDGCERFVGAGTCFEYEMAGHPLQESSPTRPATLYAATKLSVCETGQKVARQKGSKFAWGRVFYPYGPQEDPRRAVPGVINALLDSRPFPATTGEQVRDYVHVEDVAAGFATLLESGAEGVFNLCSGAPLTMRELLSLIGEQLGKAQLIEFGKFPARSYEPPYIAGDNSRLRSLGWSPRYTTASGLAQTIGWWRANRRA
jgi:nucleoside-diphosphate-sugar epimerase